MERLEAGPQQPLSSVVIEAVAAVEGVPPDDLPEPVYPTVDLEALNLLFLTDDGDVFFTYLENRVTVEAAGEVTVEPSLP